MKTKTGGMMLLFANAWLSGSSFMITTHEFEKVQRVIILEHQIVEYVKVQFFA